MIDKKGLRLIRPPAKVLLIGVILLLIINSSFITFARSSYRFGLTSSSSTGGIVQSEELDFFNEDVYSLKALNENGYEFNYWDISGKYEFITGSKTDNKISLRLLSNCSVKAVFKLNPESLRNNIEANKLVEKTRVPITTVQKPENKISFATLVAIIAVITLAVILTSVVVKYARVFFYIHHKKKVKKKGGIRSGY